MQQRTRPGFPPLFRQLGMTHRTAKNYSAANWYFDRAAAIYKSEKNSAGVMELRVIKRQTAQEQDSVGVLMEKMRRLQQRGNKEERQTEQLLHQQIAKTVQRGAIHYR